MAILESCCFWKTVRKGSYACALYTLIYFGLSTLMFTVYLKEEQEFLLGQRTQPLGESILEKGDVTVVTVIFNVLFLFCSTLMVLSSVLLIVGLRNNKRQLLLPWIGLMLCDLLIEVAHLVHLTLSRRVIFDPIVGFIFTIDFFILCLNLYCLLCVISQYQAYRIERAERQQHPALSPTVVFTAPEKLSKSKRQMLAAENASAKSKRHSHRMLAASPLITSQRPTNFSTITEEEEQCTKVPATAVTSAVSGNGNGNGNGDGDCGHISEMPTPYDSSDVEASMHTNLPIITLDPNSLH